MCGKSRKDKENRNETKAVVSSLLSKMKDIYRSNGCMFSFMKTHHIRPNHRKRAIILTETSHAFVPTLCLFH